MHQEIKELNNNSEIPLICDPVLQLGHDTGPMGTSGLVWPATVPKAWGFERIHQNNELYCLKTISIYASKFTSTHFHLKKHETLLNVGDSIAYIDITNNKKNETIELQPYQSYVISPGLVHSLRAGGEHVTLVEASTPSFDDDSIRIG